MTHTYAVLEVSAEVYAEVRALLTKAGYEHTFHEGDRDHAEVIDMHGIALAGDRPVPGSLEERSGRVGALLSDAFPQAEHPALLDWVSVMFELKRLRKVEAGVREHRDARGDDRCWQDDEALYALLPEGYTPPARDTAVELAQCVEYINCRHNPATAYVSPQREIDRLRAALASVAADIAAMANRHELESVGRRERAEQMRSLSGEALQLAQVPPHRLID